MLKAHYLCGVIGGVNISGFRRPSQTLILSRSIHSDTDTGDYDRYGTTGTNDRDLRDNRTKRSEGWDGKRFANKSVHTNKKFGFEADDFSMKTAYSNMKRASKLNEIARSKRNSSGKQSHNDDNDSIRTKMLKGFLELNPKICSGCGSNFQSKSPESPGYLTKDKMAEHILNSVVIREKQSAMHILDIAGIDADSPIASEILLAGGTKPEIVNQIKEFAIRQKRGADLSEEALERGVTALKLERDAAQKMREMSWNSKPDDSMYMSMDEYRALEKKGKSKLDGESVCICQRCFRLQQYGQVEEALRPGWSDNELLSPERFETVLGAIKKTTSVVLCLVDVFDLQGSLLPNLRAIAGPNPIVIAANKIDLLPSDVSLPRITDWIHQEIKEVCNLQSPKETADAKFSHRESTALRRDGREVVIDGDMEENGILRRSNIHLVSCTTGFGMEELMANLAKQAIQHGNRVFVMGAANVGKSSFINRMLDTKYGAMRNRRQVNRRTQRDEVPLATVSNLPGTTLDFLKIKLPNGLSMIDTPGLLNRGQLTARLSPEELKQVIPKTKVNAVTLRVEEGKCVLAGGLAMFELTEGRPFHFTFFMSNEVVLHPTSSDRARDFIERHVGTPLLSPPASLERLQALEPSVSHEFEIEGDSWQRSSYDIVVAGLGWVAVSGPGVARVRVTVPEGTAVGIRPSLMPFEANTTTASFTGGKFGRKTAKHKPGVGWRA